MARKINLVEVGPRDGYQSVAVNCGVIPTDVKLKYIDRIIDAESGVFSLLCES